MGMNETYRYITVWVRPYIIQYNNMSPIYNNMETLNTENKTQKYNVREFFGIKSKILIDAPVQ